MTKKLETVKAVVDTLYGRGSNMAREVGRSRTAIWKYLDRDQLPGDLYDAVQLKALLHGYIVDDELFTPVFVHPRFVNRTGE